MEILDKAKTVRPAKVLLIDPPSEAFIGYYRFYYPLGVVSIGSTLVADGHHVQVFDAEHVPDGACLSNAEASCLLPRSVEQMNNPAHPIWRRLEAHIRAMAPEIVGISVLSTKVHSAILTARLVRRVAPAAKIVLGGDHTVRCGTELAALPEADAVVIGEGEDTARDLLRAWQEGRDISSIPGLAFRRGGVACKTPVRPLIEDLDRVPLPDRSLLVGEDTYSPIDMGLMMTSRGCSERCAFCGIMPAYRRQVRFRSISNCLEEIARTRERYGTDFFSFRDGTFTYDRLRTVEFCRRLIDSRLDIAWECLTRPDCLDDELVDLMMQAGCCQVRLGLESGSPRILEYIRKDTTVADYKRAAAILNRRGIFWSAYVMFGVPEEGFGDIRMTLEMLDCLQPSFITAARFSPLPGTPMYEEIVRSGGKIDWSMENNMCVGPCYSRFISADDFRRLMEWILEYAAAYNREHTCVAAHRDRRMMRHQQEPEPADGGTTKSSACLTRLIDYCLAGEHRTTAASST